MFTRPTAIRVQTVPVGETLTEQAHKDKTDMHNIMRQYERTGIIEHTAKYKGQYGNFIHALDFRSATTLIVQAEEMFLSVPSKLRKRFNNDPSEYIDFMQNPDNYEEIRKMGLDPSHLPKPQPAPMAAAIPSGETQ